MRHCRRLASAALAALLALPIAATAGPLGGEGPLGGPMAPNCAMRAATWVAGSTIGAGTGYLKTNTISGAETMTMPAAASYPPGCGFLFDDGAARALTASHTASFNRAGSDTFSGGGASYGPLISAGQQVWFISDGVSKFTPQAICPATTLATHNFGTGTGIDGCPTGAVLTGGDLPGQAAYTVLGNNTSGVAAPSGSASLITQIGASSIGSMLTTAGTRYGLLNGNGNAAANPTNQPLYHNGNNLQFSCTLYNTATPPVATAPGAGNSHQFNMYLNGSITGAPTCTISGASATSCGDTVTLPAVTANEPAAYQIVTAGTPPALVAACSAAMVQTP